MYFEKISIPKCFKIKFYEDWVRKLNLKIEFFVPSNGHQNCLVKSLYIWCRFAHRHSYKCRESNHMFHTVLSQIGEKHPLNIWPKGHCDGAL